MHAFARTAHLTRERQRGAATLIVVMVLFFIISMVAGYTNRNLIFEQRAAANQYRSTVAFDAADGGVDWLLSMLNAGRINDDCTPVTDGSTPPTFRERYMQVNETTGVTTLVTAGATSPSCVLDPGTGLVCSCPIPASGSPDLPTASTTTSVPAFRTRFLSFGTRPDLFKVVVSGCSKADNQCLGLSATPSGGDAKTNVQTVMALRGALNRLPTAAVTVPDDFTATTPTFAIKATNTDLSANGVTIHRGRIAGPSFSLQNFDLTGLPGVPPLGTTQRDDSGLQPVAPGSGLITAAERRFALFFGMRPDVYRNQPGLPVIDCASTCSASVIAAAASNNPYRPIWLTGANGTLMINGTLGSDAAPVLVITEGDVVFSGSAVVKGLIYGRKKLGVDGATSDWKVSASGSAASLQGALIAENRIDMQDSSATTHVEYNKAILQRLRLTYGTFVRVTGSWKDYEL